ncbi:TonB-dependent receptor plug domain-containing protein [Dyella sedimenti]|uniref:TonB-dependent receptor plug domain-containing protein n=1 Tax=Dyella sedimenti TaxID=2919947 RepID=UPI001FAADA79|nr:TonB-dependent receptor plug domain-containing protein [Dyella sedimenti]
MSRTHAWMALMALSLGSIGTAAQTVATTEPAEQEDSGKEADGKKNKARSDTHATLPTIQVVGYRLFPYQEGMVIDQSAIDDQVKGNGDIGTLLRLNPSVQFNDTAATSRNMGEIRPAEISINGGLYYQNAFLLDGASFTNDLDPNSNNPNDINNPSSHTQGIALDTSLIGSLTVYDSNVPASYGGFNGGVVEAESRKASNRLAGRLSYRMARSAWNEVHIADASRTAFEQSSTLDSQPRYDKYQANMVLEGRTAGGIGLIANVVRTHSTIPLRGYSAGNVSEHDANRKDTTRQNTAASLRADWSNDRGLSLGASLNWAPTEERYFIQNAKDSWFDLKQGGPVMSLRANLERGAWNFRNTLSYSDLDSSRRSDARYWYSWRYSAEKNSGVSTGSLSTEGNWGSVDQTNRNIGYKLLVDHDPMSLGRTEHRVQFGAELADRKASYERLYDHYSYITPAATSTCIDASGVLDTVACSMSPVPYYSGRGQYLSRLTTYHAGYFEAQSREWALFAQDDIRLGHWNFRPGMRVDHDSLSGKTTTSPRFAASWDLFGDRNSLLTGGVNRYYGRNLFAYKLREGRETLETVQTRGASLVWGKPTQSRSATRFSDLSVPYSDEWDLGFNQRWRNLDVNLKAVHRDNRDEIMRWRVPSLDTSGYYDTNVYEYRNVGRARSNTYTLSVGLLSPWQWGPARTNAQLAFDYTDTSRSYTGSSTTMDYDNLYSESAYNAWVRYEGKLMRYYELPAGNFNRPWTARLSTQTHIDSLGLLWSNFLRYRAGYRGRAVTGGEMLGDELIDVVSNVHWPRSWTLDSALEYTLPLTSTQQAYIRVEAMNLTNRANLINGTNVYEPGRSYWLEAGYRF